MLEKQAFDAVGFVMDFESGDLTDEQIVDGFQELIDSGMAWQLQGMYGRMANHLIEEGFCTNKRRQ